MAERRNLKLFFAREFEGWARLRRRFRAAVARGRARKIRRRAACRARKEIPEPRQRSWLPPVEVLAGGASLAVHAVLFLSLYALWQPGGRAGLTAPVEVSITFHVSPPPRPAALPAGDVDRPGPPRPAPDPERPPPADEDAAGDPTPPDDPAPGPPVLARGEPEPGPRSKGEPSELPARLEAPPLPATIGLGPGGGRLPGAGGDADSPFPSRGSGKGQALGAYGGSAATEGAVTRGLRWLAAHQDEDGGWSAEGYRRHCRHHTPCGGPGFEEFDVGVTALAVLAFLGAGHAPEAPAFSRGTATPAVAGPRWGQSVFRRNVKKALDYLLAHQDGRGAFGATGENYFYNHALATFAMSEACAFAGAPRYRESVEAALAFSAATQQAGGAWDYTSKATGRNDLSITGWQIMALRAAETAGIALPDPLLERLRGYIGHAVLPTGDGIYTNRGPEADRRGINMVAVGLLSRIYLGTDRNAPGVRAAAGRILKTPPDWEATGAWDHTFQSYYYWYTATLALFHLGGAEWKAWNFFVARTLLQLQSRKPHEEGSWPAEPSWVGASGGRVYATATAVLTLETYYRYEPLLQPRKL